MSEASITTDFGEVLSRLARSSVIQGDLSQAAHELCTAAAETLQIARVNVWLFDDERTLIRCIAAHGPGSEDTNGSLLRQSEAPVYFDALEQMRTIESMDVLRDPRTREFAAYSERHGITTLVDAPIYREGIVAGVVCHEHVGPLRAWTAEEKAFCGSIADLMSICLEVNRRRLAEQAASQNEVLLHTVAEQLPDPLFLLERAPRVEPRIRYANRAAVEALQTPLSGLLGKPFQVIEHDTAPSTLVSHLEEFVVGEQLRFESVLQRTDGSTYPVEFTGRAMDSSPDSLLVLTARDLTQRRQQEQETLQSQARVLEAQRLESLGLMASGVAHDFNNLLVVILCSSELARGQLQHPNPALRMLDDISNAARRSADICKQLMNYARRDPPKQEKLDLSVLTAELLSLLDLSVGRRAILNCKFSRALPLVTGTPTQIRQIVLNLVTNAADAIESTSKSGEIVLRTRCEDLTEEYFNSSQLPWQASAGRYVCLEVQDNGCGMDAETCNRMFEAFYTTKAKGCGLGMATVMSILRDHRGALHIQTEPGKGTTIRVHLPAPRATEKVS